MNLRKTFVGFVVLGCIAASGAYGLLITDADVVAIPGDIVGSGNGTLDMLLFTESAGGKNNEAGGFNGDDANTDMPTGSTITTACESYVTSVGELRDFYELNFPGITVHELVIFVDINQTGRSGITLDALQVVTQYTQDFGDDRDDPYVADVSSELQNATGSDFGGGTLQATLDGPKALALIEQGAGFADYMIFTGVDPYDAAFSDSTRILIHWESSDHNDGGETIFLSGTYLPEPGTLALLGLGSLLWRRRR